MDDGERDEKMFFCGVSFKDTIVRMHASVRLCVVMREWGYTASACMD